MSRSLLYSELSGNSQASLSRYNQSHFDGVRIVLLKHPLDESRTVCAPHQASHVLGVAAGRVSRDWLNPYGHPIHLLEPERSGDSLTTGLPVRATAGRQTFVERERFTGTCYRAAGWIAVGDTAGRGCNVARCALPIPLPKEGLSQSAQCGLPKAAVLVKYAKFQDLVGLLRKVFAVLPDRRTGSNLPTPWRTSA